MRTLLKVLVLVIGSAIVTRIAAYVVAQQFDEGSEVSDEFRRMVIFDGLDFTSRAGGLRSAEVSVALGGAKLDLREATLDAAGAELFLANTLGGLQVLVRDDWAVTVEDELMGGGQATVEVTPPAELPEDAPRLRISLLTRVGGSVISTRDQPFG